MKKISKTSRIIVAAASLALIATYFLPVWRIDLAAPQYPEGLSMQIWLYKLTGQVEIINGLNHYIGMATLHAESFPEFRFLPYIVAFYVAVGLLVAAWGTRRALLGYVVLLILGAAAALADFYRWGYEYGHNLDPNAAIQVPGMSYRPPVIGYKQLLNFGAWSYPDWGGWIFVAAGAAVVGAYAFEAFFREKRLKRPEGRAVAVMLASVVLLSACAAEPEPIRYGQDNCHHCKMGLSDTKFGAEIVTKKGKVYKFDDVNCMQNHLGLGEVKPADIAQQLVVDFAKTQQLIPVETAFFLYGGNVRSPMNSQVAAFANAADRDKANATLKAETLTWQQVQEKFSKTAAHHH